MLMVRVAAVLCGLSLFVTACGPKASEVAQVAGPQVSCGDADTAFPVGLLTGPQTDLATGDDADRALLAELEDTQTFGAGEGQLPVTDWFRVVSRSDFASWVRSEDRRAVLASVDFGQKAGVWSYLRSSPAGCALRRVESGATFASVGFATVRGADVELSAEAGSCGGSGPTLDRVEVEETAQSVTVVVRLRPRPAPPEGQSCLGVGEVLPVPIKLERPLGSRTLLDGSQVPAAKITT